MKRVKIVRKLGDSAGIILNREEREIYGVDIGDTVEVTIDKLGDTNAS